VFQTSALLNEGLDRLFQAVAGRHVLTFGENPISDWGGSYGWAIGRIGTGYGIHRDEESDSRRNPAVVTSPIPGLTMLATPATVPTNGRATSITFPTPETTARRQWYGIPSFPNKI
jgi:hypothetical protein